MNYKIYPPDGILETEIRMPLSKSVSNRSLIINALTHGATPLTAVADCTDTQIMQQALNDDAATDVYVADAGTSMRFLTAYFAMQTGRTVVIDGTARMRCRPIGPLVDALKVCGADIEYVGQEGYPPLKIVGKKLTGGDVRMDATVSSQYVSALLMVAPLMNNGLHLTLEGEIASLPYIDLTIDLMTRCGIDCERTANEISVSQGEYKPVDIPAEGDWSAAAFWYEIAALTGGFVTLKGMNPESRQPDRRSIDLFGQLGVVTESGDDGETVDLSGSPDVSPRLSVDLSDTPDLAPAIAVTCGMIGVPFRLSGLESLRIKETDRIAAIANELRKIGVVTEIIGDHTMSWDGRRHPLLEIPVFETYGDHRMAMALAPVAAYIPGITVKDVEVVAKSYPGFWDDLRNAGFDIADDDQSGEISINESDRL